MELEFSDRFSKHIQILNFMEINPVGAEFFHEDERTDRQRYDEANSRFA
jgi:hypothetical protein